MILNGRKKKLCFSFIQPMFIFRYFYFCRCILICADNDVTNNWNNSSDIITYDFFTTNMLRSLRRKRCLILSCYNCTNWKVRRNGERQVHVSIAFYDCRFKSCEYFNRHFIVKRAWKVSRVFKRRQQVLSRDFGMGGSLSNPSSRCLLNSVDVCCSFILLDS